MNLITSDSYVSKLFTEPASICGNKRRLGLSRKLFLRLLVVCEFVIDFLTCAATIFTANLLHAFMSRTIVYSLYPIAFSVIAGLFTVVLLQQSRKENKQISIHSIHETAVEVRVSLLALALLLSGSIFLPLGVPPSSIILAFLLMPLVLMLQKQIFTAAIRRLHSRGYGIERVVVYGAGEMGRRITSTLLSSTRLALQPIAIIDEDPELADDCSFKLTYRGFTGVTVQCISISADLLQSFHCDLLAVAIAELSTEQRERLTTIARQAGARVIYLTEASLDGDRVDCVEINGLLLPCESAQACAWTYAYSKRIFDIILSSILLVLFLPVFFLIALSIRVSSHGPAIFVQKRVGRNGRLFRMYKFRSMYCCARRYECSPRSSCDPRITKLGRFLRRTSLDELPQLLNVLLGQMSLVGPRPEMPFIARQYNNRQRQRLRVLPGITGLWQLSRDRVYPIHKNLHHDLSYIRHRTLSLDLAILIHTLFFAMRRGI